MKKLILIDGNSLLYRAYYATAYTGNLMKSSKGFHTNAIYAFTIMMMNIIENYQFSHILVAFDAGKQTFRHSDYKEYKGGRKPTPTELLEQIPIAKQFLDVINVKRYEKVMYEADDIIGTMAHIAEENYFDEVQIISSDKDLLQLITNKAYVDLTKKGLTELDRFTIEHLRETMNISPKQIVDLKGLMGDASDNIPGIPGVGEKTALKFLNEYQSVENLINNIDKLKGKMKEKVEVNKDLAILSKKLATIDINAPVDISLDDTKYQKYEDNVLLEFLQYLDFHSLIKRLNVKDDKESDEIEFKILDETSDLNKILITDSFIIIETFGQNYHNCDVLGMAISNKEGNFYLPFEVMQSSLLVNMFLADELIKKSIFDYKSAKVALKYLGYELNGIEFDLLTAAYIINPTLTKDDFRVITSYFDYNNVNYDEEIYGKNTKYSKPSVDIVSSHAIKKAYAIKSLKQKIIKKLEENDQIDIYYNLELPLSIVLADMEYTGIKISRNTLTDLGDGLRFRITNLEKAIYQDAFKEFNINSPKQLGEVLFVDLKLPVQKKTKTGYSTNMEVLEKLKDENPIINKIIEYRTITKLYNTYVEGLQQVIYQDNKIHTIFKQTLTQTGRLSSAEPNIQNIPIRYEEGRQIRRAFVASNPDGVILAADYSQIELRVLAHISGAENLVEAFMNDLDIHTKTAMDVFSVSQSEVTSLMRRQAKAVNFGIIYGISAFGLSVNLGIQPKEAQKFIDKYLEAYPGIKIFMDDVVKNAKEKGYVETLYKRRRYIPELKSRNYNERMFGERSAMNAPIQGSAADIIKIAMINVYNRLNKEQLKSKLLIQVHDELIFDVVNGEVEIMKKIVKEEMENAVKLKVPLKVDMNFGPTWYDAK